MWLFLRRTNKAWKCNTDKELTYYICEKNPYLFTISIRSLYLQYRQQLLNKFHIDVYTHKLCTEMRTIWKNIWTSQVYIPYCIVNWAFFKYFRMTVYKTKSYVYFVAKLTFILLQSYKHTVVHLLKLKWRKS